MPTEDEFLTAMTSDRQPQEPVEQAQDQVERRGDNTMKAAIALILLSASANAQQCLPDNNTCLGREALLQNLNGSSNTAIGAWALQSNVDGHQNTALGAGALSSNIGNYNVAAGYAALFANTNGVNNSAVGSWSLQSNTLGRNNSALGFQSLVANLTGSSNTAVGVNSMYSSLSGSYNTALGLATLKANSAGLRNIAVGYQAGYFTEGNDNILIGHRGVKLDNATIRIGSPSQTRAFISGIYGNTILGPEVVTINSSGQLGTADLIQRIESLERRVRELEAR